MGFEVLLYRVLLNTIYSHSAMLMYVSLMGINSLCAVLKASNSLLAVLLMITIITGIDKLRLLNYV